MSMADGGHVHFEFHTPATCTDSFRELEVETRSLLSACYILNVISNSYVSKDVSSRTQPRPWPSKASASRPPPPLPASLTATRRQGA